MARRLGDIPAGGGSALDFAVSARDAGIIEMVRRAIEHKEVLLAFQPVVRADDPERIAFHEGLVRVLDASGRVIPARDFIPVVEDTEYGRMLDCLALSKGLSELRREPGLRLAINMSARSIGYRHWMRILDRSLDEDPTVGERLILEITEHSAILIPEIVVSFMADLQRRGISFALDDFGSGFTALRYFKDFFFDILKIDAQFIDGIADDIDNQVLVRAMLAIAEQFDMFTVAEAVERPQDAAFLTSAGLDCLQGYLFGAPSLQPSWRRDPARDTA